MNTDRIETGFVFETAGVDRGVERVERAFDRLDKAEQKAVKAQQAREQEAARKSLDVARQTLKEREKLEQDAHETRLRLTEQEYKRLDALERTRLANMRQQMQQNQIRAGINPNGTAAGRAGSGHGGHGGGLLGGQARLIGDMLDQATGKPGWVMKLQGAESIAGHLGRSALPFAPAALLGYEAYRTASAAGREMGETTTANERLRTETSALSRTSTFANAGQGPLSLGEQLSKVREQQRAELEQSAKLEATRRKMSGDFDGIGDRFNPLTFLKRDIYQGMDSLRHTALFGRSPTNAQQIGMSEQRSRELAGDERRIKAQQTEAYAHARDTADARLNRSPFEAERMEANLARVRETADAERLNASAKDKELIQQKFDIEMDRIRHDETAANNQLTAERRLIAGRRAGLNEVETAQLRIDAAQMERLNARTTQEKAAAKNRVDQSQLEFDVAARNLATHRRNLMGDLEVAGNRGNTEDRSLLAADTAEYQAAARLRALRRDRSTRKGVTQEQIDDAQKQADSTKTARILLEREQSVARSRARSADYQANIRFGAELRNTGAGAVDQHRNTLQAEVDLAKEQRRLAAEIAEKEHDSLASVEALHRAQEGVANSLLKQKQYEVDLARSRRVELGNAETESAALRLQNVGRGDSAAMLRSRRSSENAQYEALRESNPQLAAELAEQQRSRETGSFLDKFYNADGTKKDRGQINREEQQARLTEGRRGRAAGRFERDLGLINVRRGMGGEVLGGTDPFTHQHVTAAEVRARLNNPADRAAHDRQDAATQVLNYLKDIAGAMPKPSNN